MNKLQSIVVTFAFSCVSSYSFAGCIGPVIMGECHGTLTGSDANSANRRAVIDSNSLQLNAYGPGVHKNRYGQAVTLEPQGGAVLGESLILRLDAFGPGIHMDQYGRPVKEKKF